MDVIPISTDPVVAPKRAGRKFIPAAAKLKQVKSEPRPEPEPNLVLPPSSNKIEDHHVKPPQLHPSSIDDTTTIETKLAAVELMEEDVEEEVREEPMDVVKEDEEDKVVREIDVFYTPPTDGNSQLYVMQYPLRPSWRPYELDERCKEVRVKPKDGKVEIDLSLDSNSNYDSNAPGSMKITKQTLSSWKPTLTTSYAVGVLSGNKLHLNPVHAVVQLRPSLEHLKPGGLKKSSAAESVENQSTSRKQGKMVNSSTEQGTDAEPEESWISLEYHSMDSNESSLSTRYRKKMKSQEGAEIQFSMSPDAYINSLCPGSSTKNDRDRKLSKRYLRSLPVDRRFRVWFSEGPQLNRFNVLKHLALDESNEDLLKTLQSYACVVKGLWIPNTSSLAKKFGPTEALARDYVLLLFKKNTVIRPTQLQEYGLHKKAEPFLNIFGVHNPSLNEWKFKEPEDKSFTKEYPQIVHEQEKLWAVWEKNIIEKLENRKIGPVKGNASTSGMSNIPKNPDQGTKRPLNETAALRPNLMSTLRKPVEALLRKHNVCSLQFIWQGLQELGVSKTITSPPPELNSILDLVAVKVCDVYVLKSLGDATVDPLRGVVIELFGVSEPHAKLKRAEIVEFAKIKGVAVDEYTKVMGMLCTSVKGSNAWMLKNGNGNAQINSLHVPSASNSKMSSGKTITTERKKITFADEAGGMLCQVKVFEGSKTDNTSH